MRVTIEDGVYNLLEVKIEFMFDNGKERMIQRTGYFFLIRAVASKRTHPLGHC